ncbi:MAG: hypothetical protein IH593_12020 [Bacteroidales bacterium]|nr:hypothetical protein [Bacteroidales bacterium]
MKRIFTVIVALTVISVFAVKGQEQENLDRLTAYKIAFFTRKLSLSSVEAEKFWPVYNDFSARKSKIQIDRVALMRYAAQNESNMSNEELSATADKLADSFVDEADLIVKFNTDVKKILPPAKVIRLFQAENQYKQQLLRELNQRKQVPGTPGIRRQQ